MVQLFLLGLPGLLLLLLQGHQVGPLLLQLPLETLRLPLLLYLLTLVLLRWGQRRETGEFPESELRIRKRKLEVTGRGRGMPLGGLTWWIPKDVSINKAWKERIILAYEQDQNATEPLK